MFSRLCVTDRNCCRAIVVSLCPHFLANVTGEKRGEMGRGTGGKFVLTATLKLSSFVALRPSVVAASFSFWRVAAAIASSSRRRLAAS